MAVSILDTLVDKADGAQKSASWYRRAVGSIADRITARKLINPVSYTHLTLPTNREV